VIASFCGDAFVADGDKDYLEGKIKNVVDYLIKDGRIVFISDGCTEFGLLCKKVIEDCKKDYPSIAYVPAMKYIAPGYKKGNYDVQIRGSIEMKTTTEARRKCTEYMFSKADVVVYYLKNPQNSIPEITPSGDVISITL